MPSSLNDAFIGLVFRDSFMKPISILDSFTVAGRALAVGLTFATVAVCAVCAVWTPAAVAQTASIHHSPALREAAPRKAGVSPERLARIDAVCEQAIRAGGPQW
jgi:hypothetical protein